MQRSQSWLGFTAKIREWSEHTHCLPRGSKSRPSDSSAPFKAASCPAGPCARHGALPHPAPCRHNGPRRAASPRPLPWPALCVTWRVTAATPWLIARKFPTNGNHKEKRLVPLLQFLDLISNCLLASFALFWILNKYNNTLRMEIILFCNALWWIIAQLPCSLNSFALFTFTILSKNPPKLPKNGNHKETGLSLFCNILTWRITVYKGCLLGPLRSFECWEKKSITINFWSKEQYTEMELNP